MRPQFRLRAGLLLMSLLASAAVPAAASLVVDTGEHPNYDVQMPANYSEPPPEILSSIARSCPQCRVIFGQDVIGYVSAWDPSQTVVWTPFRAGLDDDADPMGGYDDEQYYRPPLIPIIPPPEDPSEDPGDSTVPEPATLWLAGAALVGVNALRRRGSR